MSFSLSLSLSLSLPLPRPPPSPPPQTHTHTPSQALTSSIVLGVNIQLDLAGLKVEVPHIIVGTPGRVMDLATKRKVCTYVRAIKWVKKERETQLNEELPTYFCPLIPTAGSYGLMRLRVTHSHTHSHSISPTHTHAHGQSLYFCTIGS